VAFSGGPTGQTVLQVHSEAEFIVVSSVKHISTSHRRMSRICAPSMGVPGCGKLS